ncbi:Poly(A) RNA polymerase cid13 [Verticillium dahliae VDG1]|nr:Poly(A) RNA polymerase cid13 [Verticillium dahliae VDG1]
MADQKKQPPSAVDILSISVGLCRPGTSVPKNPIAPSSYTPARYGQNFAKESTPSQAPSEISTESRDPFQMAHCQLRGPLVGPLRERRRSELSAHHPVWDQARNFQSDLMTIQQAIRRAPGIPSKVSEELCGVLVNQSQQVNNAIRETVDDSSELRIQVEEANMAIMGLKINDTAVKVDLEQNQKRIKELIEMEEKAENRLAKYHADAEQDRNEIRVILARLTANEEEEAKAKINDELIATLKEQLSASHSIEPEPESKEPTAIDQAMAKFQEAQAQEDADGTGSTEANPANLPSLDVADLANVTPTRGSNMHHVSSYGNRDIVRGTFAGESAFSPLNIKNSGNGLPSTMQPPSWTRPNSRGMPESINGLGSNIMRSATPASQNGFNGGGAIVFSRPMSRMGQHGGAGPRSGPPAFRPKAPEFHPGHNGLNGSGSGSGSGHGNAIVQMSNTQYDNRAVVARSQPVIPLGQTYGGITDDLGRFEEAFQELFGIARGFIGTWVGAEDAANKREAAIIQYLPKVYHPFTEQQAWSYIRQHLNDGLARSCLFARVVVDFIVQRILVPTAWQGFGFQTDRRIQQVDEELSRGPMMTGSARNEYNSAVSEIVNSILDNERYEQYRESRIEYFATELQSMLGPLMNEFADLEQAGNDLRSVVGKAWSLSAKTLTSRMTFEYRFPEAGCRFSMQSMVAVAPSIDGYVLQAEHWRVQLVVTPVITVRNDNGSTLSVHVTNLAEVLLMK